MFHVLPERSKVLMFLWLLCILKKRINCFGDLSAFWRRVWPSCLLVLQNVFCVLRM